MMSQIGSYSIFIKSQLLALLLTSLAACSNLPESNNPNTEATDTLEPAIVNRAWELSGYRGSDGVTSTFTNERGHKFTINFGFFEISDGRIVRQVSGIEACNTYGGNFALDRNLLVLSNVTATVVGCQERNRKPGIVFDRVLNDSPRIFIEGNRLQMISESEERLLFTDRTQSI